VKYFAPCPPGAGEILARELEKLGAGSIETAPMGVGFLGDIKTSYDACLELRTASRLLLELFSGSASDEDELYRLAADYDWALLFSPDRTISCRVTGVPMNRDPRFAALRLKDAVADRFSRNGGVRPSVDRKTPDVRIEARWDGRYASVYLNWSGAPLHERGYRTERTDAVLRETAAASVLAIAGWTEMAVQKAAFVDPVCGSGTLLAEAAMMAVDAPPGVHRRSWGFEALRTHNDSLWNSIRNKALIRYGESLEKLPIIAGFDNDENALRIARANLRRAGLQQSVRMGLHDISRGRPEFWPRGSLGMICADPPYGHRVSGDPLPVYKALGDLFRTLESGWKMALLAPDRKTASATCLRAETYKQTVSGGKDIVLALYGRLGKTGEGSAVPSFAASFPGPEKPAKNHVPVPEPVADNAPDPKADSLKKLLEKNLNTISAWAAKKGVTSFRIWDADMPEFNAAVDWYEGRWLHVQEFAAPAKVPPETTRRRLETLLSALKELTGCPDDDLFLKTRQRGIRPYGKMGSSGERYIVRENSMRFYVNFTDYLDTGIFLDHRATRARIRDLAGNGKFLNLFAYTGTATVMAAAGGAEKTVSVDVSNTYLEWAHDNLKLNGMDKPSHLSVRSDAFDFLDKYPDLFNLIFIDPPTYSNGTGRKDWSVQDDHARLIRSAMDHLENDGTLIFAENFRQFVFDPDLKNDFSVAEITRETTDPDFVRRGGAHRCWVISHR
jgi:23S rRNA (guanine2445-N2)-methyltransferase / 23S rRNA (guanine2069-N7)-methyltransferase